MEIWVIAHGLFQIPVLMYNTAQNDDEIIELKLKKHRDNNKVQLKKYKSMKILYFSDWKTFNLLRNDKDFFMMPFPSAQYKYGLLQSILVNQQVFAVASAKLNDKWVIFILAPSEDHILCKAIAYVNNINNFVHSEFLSHQCITNRLTDQNAKPKTSKDYYVKGFEGYMKVISSTAAIPNAYELSN